MERGGTPLLTPAEGDEVDPLESIDTLMRELARVPPLDTSLPLAPGPAAARFEPPFSPAAVQDAAGATRAPRAVQLGSVLGQRYELRELLGRGGMGTVYGACNLRTRREVAIKVLERDATDVRQREVVIRFLREARAAARIHHPNVLDLYDVDCDQGVFYMVMERLYGESLRTRLGRGAVEPRTAARIMRDAMLGVAEAHRCGVIHRDLKPDNVFLASLPGTPLPDPAAQVKVLDFGVSRIVANQEYDLHSRALTRTGQLLGTLLYMPPEQLRGDPQLDARADVYALGVTLYELVSGRRPYEANNERELLACQLELPVPSLEQRVKGLDPALNALVMCALHRRPEARYPSVECFATVLSAWLDGEAGAPEPRKRAVLPARVDASLARFDSLLARATARVDSRRRPHKRTLLIGSLFALVLAILSALKLSPQSSSSASRHEPTKSREERPPAVNSGTAQEHAPAIPARLTEPSQPKAEQPAAAPSAKNKKEGGSRGASRIGKPPSPLNGSPAQTPERETLLLPSEF